MGLKHLLPPPPPPPDPKSSLMIIKESQSGRHGVTKRSACGMKIIYSCCTDHHQTISKEATSAELVPPTLIYVVSNFGTHSGTRNSTLLSFDMLRSRGFVSPPWTGVTRLFHLALLIESKSNRIAIANEDR